MHICLTRGPWSMSVWEDIRIIWDANRTRVNLEPLTQPAGSTAVFQGSQSGSLLPESNLRLVYLLCYFCLTLSCTLYCCSQVFVLFDFCKPLSFYISLTIFSGVFSTIIVFLFLAFIAIPYCSQVASSLTIIMLKLLLTLCQYHCVICMSDVCDILSIDVYPLSIL